MQFNRDTTHTALNPLEAHWHYRISHSCKMYLGCELDYFTYSGDHPKGSIRLVLKNKQTAIFSWRGSSQRTALESVALNAIRAHTTLVPRLYLFDGSFILQEDIAGETLASSIQNKSEASIESLLDNAIAALLQIQRAAEKAGLQSHNDIPLLGRSMSWYMGLLCQPALIGEILDIMPPVLDLQTIKSILSAIEPRFIKWDARPCNAMVTAEETIKWFDWQYSGIRNKMDDLVWFLGDESIPDFPQLEAALLDKYLPKFASGKSLESARDYFYLYGCLHICARLQQLFEPPETNNSARKFLQETAQHSTIIHPKVLSERLCQRGIRWSALHPLTAPLTSWFEEIRNRILALE